MVLRGAFMANGDTYHVTTRTHYHIQKRSDDALPYSSPSPGSSLIIYRDSDLYDRAATQMRRKRGTEDGSTGSNTCGADALMKLEDTHPLGAKATGVESALTDHEFYYPPNLTTSIPDPSSSWMDLLAGGVGGSGGLRKRAVAMGVAGPEPVPEGCPTNRLVNYMVTHIYFMCIFAWRQIMYWELVLFTNAFFFLLYNREWRRIAHM